VFQLALGDQEPHHLGQEKGIAFRLSVNSLDKYVRRHNSRCHLDESGHVRSAESGQRHSLAQPLPRQLGECLR